MISIIVPVFNAAPFLKKCIESILNQTYKDFELILIDDGSTDMSLDICRNYALKDARIIVLSKINEGAGLARNLGLKIAKGEYIGFVDSDDYISPNMYEELYTSALKNNADIVQCGYIKVDENNNFLSKSNYQNIIIENNELCFKEFCKKRNIDNYSPCKIFKKETIKDVFFGNYSYSEDAFFIIQAFLNCKKLVVLSSNLYFYVQTKGSTCRRPYNDKFKDTITVGEYMYNLTLERYPHLAYYFARYTAVWCRFNYFGLKKQNKRSDQLLEEYMSKYKYYYSLSRIYLPLNMETILLLLFRISPSLYELLKKN